MIKKIFKYLLFVLTSTLMPLCLSYLYFYFFEEDGIINSMAFVGTMIIAPSVGFAAGILFLIIHSFFLKKHQDKKKYYIIRIGVYILIYVLALLSVFIKDFIYAIKN